MNKKALTTMIASIALLTTGCSTLNEMGHKDNEVTGERERNNMSEGLALGAAFGVGTAAVLTTHGATIAYSALAGTGFFGIIGHEKDQEEEIVRAKLEELGIDVKDHFDEVIISLDEDVTFDLQKTILKEEFKPTLDGIAMVLKRIEDRATFEVIGHTDYTGGKELNKYLSQERAAVVTEYLVEQGVDPSKINNFYGVSESDPKEYCLELSCLRRVEIKVYKNDELIKID